MYKFIIYFCVFTLATFLVYGGGGCKLSQIVYMCPDPPKGLEAPSDHLDWYEGELGPCRYLNRGVRPGPLPSIQFGDGSKMSIRSLATDNAKTLKIYQKLYYDSFAKKYKYTINEAIRLKSSTNLELFLRHYEKEAKKANVEIKITRISRYEYNIEGHEDLPKPRVKWSNPFDKMIEGRVQIEMKEDYKKVSLATKKAMKGKRRNEIATAIEQAWEEHLTNKKYLISYYDLAQKELHDKRKAEEQKDREEKEKEKIARKKLANKTVSQKKEASKQEDIRTFTNKSGAEIKGRLVGVAYLKKAAVLRINRDERLYVPISLFCESDLEYIKAWWRNNS